MKYNFGVVKELKEGETRVSMSPDAVKMLTTDGFSVLIESGAGALAGFSDEEYIENGATVAKSTKEVWDNSKIIVKVKEPQAQEYQYFRADLVIFCYMHLAVDEALTKELLKKKVTAIAAESVERADGTLPLLIPMSEVAGRLAVQMGANFLEFHKGGSGVLLSGVPGVQPGKVTIIGGGTVGANAARMAIGMGADVSIFDNDPIKLVKLDNIWSTSIKTHYSNHAKLEQEIPKADILITCVLKHSEVAPKIITEDMVKKMKKGSVIIDVAIDQGGNVETVDRITSHQNPTFEKFGILHCAIPNLPSATPKTASYAYSYATYPYLKSLAEKGVIEAIKENPELLAGVNTFNGETTNEAVANAHELDYTQIELLVGFKLK